MVAAFRPDARKARRLAKAEAAVADREGAAERTQRKAESQAEAQHIEARNPMF